MQQTPFTDIEKQFIKNNYGKLTYSQIATILNRSRGGVGLCAMKLKLTGATKHYSTYTYNRNAFRELSLESFYWAGFCAADGCIGTEKNGKQHNLSIGLQARDANHLENFKIFLKSDNSIKYSQIWNKSKTKLLDICKISIFGIREMKDDLENIYNIVPRKTKIIKPPNTNDKQYLLSFLLGYLCGDGCIRIDKRRGMLTLSCLSSSTEIIEWMNKFLSNFIVYTNTRTNNVRYNEKYASFSFGGIKAAILIDLLRQIPVPKLDRKWNNPLVLARIEEYKKIYPNLFHKFKDLV